MNIPPLNALKVFHLKEERVKELGKIHTRYHTAASNSAITESIRKMGVLSEEYWQNLGKLF